MHFLNWEEFQRIKAHYIRRPDVAKLFGVTERTIYNWERKEGFPRERRLPNSKKPVGFVRTEVENWMEKLPK